MSEQHLFKDQQFDVDLLQFDLKINWGYVLPRGIHYTFRGRGQKILSGHRLVYRPIDNLNDK